LSYDHKAVDEDERARVKKTDCFIIGGRIGGVLSVSRSFGDRELKQWVISEPHFIEIKLQENDTHLVLGCDGVSAAAFDDSDNLLLRLLGCSLSLLIHEKTGIRCAVR
jgi:serine/threonine protein phosphatase PrpC